MKNEGEVPGFVAFTMGLPSVTELVSPMDERDYESAYKARKILRKSIAQHISAQLKEVYARRNNGEEYSKDQESVQNRSMKNAALSMLVAADESTYAPVALEQFRNADNMTDSIAAVSILTHSTAPEREVALSEFYEKWHHNQLVMDKWLSTQSRCNRDSILEDIAQLEKNAVYDNSNPNRVRSLIGGFMGNIKFHAADGSGYAFIADKIIELDAKNPKIASGLAKGFKMYAKMDEGKKGSYQNTS